MQETHAHTYICASYFLQLTPQKHYQTQTTQQPNLFTGSLYYNIAYCKGKDARMDDPQLQVRIVWGAVGIR